jgi:predicted dehydrogenase
MIGRAHIDAIGRDPGCVLSAIVDPSPAARVVADRAGVPLYASLTELFAAAPPDGVVLATPNVLHVPQALECVAAGVATLLEKPIAPTVVDARRLVSAVDAAGARLLIGHHRAHSPIMAKAKAIIDAGQLGRLVGVMGSATFCKPDHYFDDGPWRREPGGGPILINMIHEIHSLRMLCGEIVAVQALASTAIRGFPVEDTVTINLRFASGALGAFLLSDTAASARSWEQTSRENPAYPAYDDEDCYIISGTLGSLAVPTMRLKTYPREQDRSWWKPFDVSVAGVVRDDPLKRQIAHFAAVIRGDATPLVTARDGLANLRVTEAITVAASSGAVVDVAAD